MAPMGLLHNVDAVLEAVADLRELRNQLATIDEARASVEDRIRTRLAQIASATVPTASAPSSFAQDVSPGRSSGSRLLRVIGMADRVLASLHQMAGADLAAPDVAMMWGVEDEGTINSIRAALSRLNAAGKIKKVGYGRYTVAAGGESAS